MFILTASLPLPPPQALQAPLEPSINDVTQNFHDPIHAIYQKYCHVLHNPPPPLGVLSLTSFMDDPFPLPSIPLRENEVVKSASKD